MSCEQCDGWRQVVRRVGKQEAETMTVLKCVEADIVKLQEQFEGQPDNRRTATALFSGLSYLRHRIAEYLGDVGPLPPRFSTKEMERLKAVTDDVAQMSAENTALRAELALDEQDD